MSPLPQHPHHLRHNLEQRRHAGHEIRIPLHGRQVARHRHLDLPFRRSPHLRLQHGDPIVHYLHLVLHLHGDRCAGNVVRSRSSKLFSQLWHSYVRPRFPRDGGSVTPPPRPFAMPRTGFIPADALAEGASSMPRMSRTLQSPVCAYAPGAVSRARANGAIGLVGGASGAVIGAGALAHSLNRLVGGGRNGVRNGVGTTHVGVEVRPRGERELLAHFAATQLPRQRRDGGGGSDNPLRVGTSGGGGEPSLRDDGCRALRVETSIRCRTVM